MLNSPLSRFTSVLTSLLLISVFTAAQAATDSLGEWTAKNPGLSNTGNYDIYGMAYGNNTYVIVGHDTSADRAFIATSTDAKKWTIKPSASASSVFNSVIFSKGRFIAVSGKPSTGNSCIWTSDTNGNSWVARSSDLIVEGGLNAVAGDGNGNLLAVGEFPTEWTDWNGWITFSTDNGNSWKVVRDGATYKTFPTKFFGAGYALGNWYALGANGVYKSNGTDCANWTYPEDESSQFYTQSDDSPGYKFASNQTTVVVASLSGPKWSNDGITWHDGSHVQSASSLYGFASGVVYADGKFVLATRNSGDIWTSEDGKSWERWTLPTSEETYALCYANKSFWCGGRKETLSTNSSSWYQARLGGSSDFPYTMFDTEDTPPNRIGLPQYRVNTASLNLVLESTLFYMKTLGSPISLKLVYNSQPCPDDATSIGPFGKNWRFRYESVILRSEKDAQLVNGGGKSYSFTAPPNIDLTQVKSDVTLNSPTGTFDTLKYIYNAGNPRFELTLKDSHLTYVYGEAGTGDKAGLFYLTGIKDQFENATTLTYSISVSGQIDAITDSSSRVISFTYDDGLCTHIGILPDGSGVNFTYDAHKNLTGITDMTGCAGTYAYDSNGFITSMTTENKTTTFTYNDRPGVGNGDKYLASVTRPGSYGTIRYELLDGGKTVKRTDPYGKSTLVSNSAGQTTSIKDPLGHVRSIAFNAVKLPETVTDENGGSFKYEYDSRGNMTKKTDALGNVTNYTYDTDDNMTTVTTPLLTGNVWTYEYSVPASLHRLEKITTPGNHATHFAYDNNGRLTSIKDARDNYTYFGYNGGDVTTITSPSGVTTFGYDGTSRCTSITDPNSKLKYIFWDSNDRLTTVRYESVAGTPSYTNFYSAFGQTSFRDELGMWTYADRDDLGSITSIMDPLGNVTQMQYDMDNRLVKTIDPLMHTASTSYDSAGRPTIFTDGKSYQVVRGYDSAGNLLTFRDSNYSTTTYKYDKNGRLESIMDPLLKYNTMTRTEIGQIASTTNARNQTINYTYEPDGWLKEKTPATDDTPATKVVYERDANGNVTKRTETLGADSL